MVPTRVMGSARRYLAAIVLTSLAACSSQRPRAISVDRGPGPSPESDPLGAALHADVVRRGGPMEEVGGPLRGALAADGSAERNVVLEAGYCYAVFGRVAEDAGELRMRILDANHDPRQLDRERGPGATIGLEEPLCPEPTNEFRLELRAERAGAYALRVLRTSLL